MANTELYLIVHPIRRPWLYMESKCRYLANCSNLFNENDGVNEKISMSNFHKKLRS